MYQIPYEADFECPKGHVFVAKASPLKSELTARCPRCFEAWIAANVPNGRQCSNAREVPTTVKFL